eukprot:UN15325
MVREAEMLQRCSNHPNVCNFVGIVFDQVDKQVWLITDYYKHGSLKDYMTNNEVSLKMKYEFIRQGGLGLNLYTK